MLKRKRLVSIAALLGAIALFDSGAAFADKGAKAPGESAGPNANLGLGAIPKVGIGLSMMGPGTNSPRTVGSTSPGDLTPTGDNDPLATRNERERDGGDTQGSGQKIDLPNGGSGQKASRASYRLTSGQSALGGATGKRTDQLPTCR